LIQDESPDQPTDDTPTPEDEENVEPTTAPDETPGVPEGEPAEDPGAAPDETLSEVAEEAPPAETPETTAAEAGDVTEPAQEQRRPPRPSKAKGADEPEVIPGAHLEPDLVLEQQAAEAGEDDYSRYAEEVDEEPDATPEPEAPAVRSPLELAADARYYATGKRKSAIARVTLKPGSGVYTINGKTLEQYFPRDRLQVQARQPLDATGNLSRMDVVARIHGGGVAAQATALRHGIARALVDAEPTLRTELKRRGFLTRDPREVERKKAGLKKARKRPQFSKR
jgi:small subunit ribosomal protein S9